MAIAHLRTYTVNKGMMDDWLEVFPTLIEPMKEAGISVESTWLNADRTQFIWIRSYGDSIEKCEAAFYGSDWWLANVDHIRSHIAHRVFEQIESA